MFAVLAKPIQLLLTMMTAFLGLRNRQRSACFPAIVSYRMPLYLLQGLLHSSNFVVAAVWEGFESGSFLWGILGVLGFLFFSFVGVRELAETAAPATKRSRSIPQDVKIAVAVRDQGCCQHCGTFTGPME